MGLFFFGLHVAPPLMAATWSLENFVLHHNGTEDDIARIHSQNNVSEICFKTSSHLICIKSRIIPNSNKNKEVRHASLKILSHQVKHLLYTEMIKSVNQTKLQNRNAVLGTYIYGIERNNNNYILSNIENANFYDGDKIISVVSVPYTQAVSVVKKILDSSFFSIDYCKKLFPKAKLLYKDNKYNEALVLLKEIHDLKWANAEAYVMAADSFLKIGNLNDSLKIANEVLSELKLQLTPDIAENLGDIFLELGKIDEAEESFKLALTLLNSK
ncbi:MAG: tetratricopeptide repeat protein [Bacteroidaceae bacterium]|nr:tetratricopeptide repeat protein [Bacteroidaceae bacterium]